MEKLRVGYIGLGGRGYGVLNGIINNMNDIDIVVVCDLKEDRMQKGKKKEEEK